MSFSFLLMFEFHKTKRRPYSSILQHKTGLPISTYFSAVKLRWLLDNVDEVRQAVLSERAMFGTVDSWIIWVRGSRVR